MNDSKSQPLLLGEAIRQQFPFFGDNPALPSDRRRIVPAYLDSAATSQKPRCVIERMTRFLSYENANIHRGAYQLSGVATENFEDARARIADFIGASSPNCIVFTRGTTDSINLVARALEPELSEGDAIVLTLLEHHSNIVPWQLLAQRKRLKLYFADISDQGVLNLDDLAQKIAATKPKIVSVTHVSNALGTLVPIKAVCALAHSVGATTVVDAAQSVSHMALDVDDIDCDFLAFSGHKLYGPTGVGVLYGKEQRLAALEPVYGGGGMISSVSTEKTTWADAPQRFEAGTPPIAEVLGLAAAVEFVRQLGMAQIEDYEEKLLYAAMERLAREKAITLYGPALHGGEQKGIISFTIDGVHPHDFSTIADTFNVQLRAGHHCAMPLLKRLGLQSTARISFGLYSIMDDVEALCEAVHFAQKKFS